MTYAPKTAAEKDILRNLEGEIELAIGKACDAIYEALQTALSQAEDEAHDDLYAALDNLAISAFLMADDPASVFKEEGIDTTCLYEGEPEEETV